GRDGRRGIESRGELGSPPGDDASARGGQTEHGGQPARRDGRSGRGVAPMNLETVRAVVLDVDGTLVHRIGDEVHVQPGAREVLARIRASGRRLAIFTNGSHEPPEWFAG